MNLKSKIYRGFTLIELLVVIAIIGILITVGSVSYLRAIRLSRDSKRKTDLEQIRQALETYRAENRQYPTPDLNPLEPDYITAIPDDPKAPDYSYTYTPAGTPTTTYQLCAELEAATPTTYCVNQP